MKNLRKILEFQKLLKELNQVYRDLGSIHDNKLKDNDVEHSYRVAMLCWMIVEENKPKLDINKVIKYALLHDLTEAYAGDHSMYSNYDQKHKEKMEHVALIRLKKKFPKLKSIWKLIETYEKKEDEESRFVYIIEKLEPVLVVFLSENDHWIKRKVSHDDFIIRKQRKIKNIDSYAQKFNEEIMEYVRKHKKKFFGKV